jgi:magnesium transporter
VPAVQLCARRFAETHPEDAARLLEQSPSADAASILSELPSKVGASVVNQMNLAAGAEILSLLSLEQAAAVAAEAPLSSAASMLRRLDATRRAELVAALPEDRREQLDRLLAYEDGTVGAVTDPEVLAIPSDLTSEAAQRLLLRRTGTFHHQLYVVDRARRLLGYLHVRDLVRAASKTPVTSIMRPPTVRLQAGARLASSISLAAWRDLDAIPVVDNTGILLGILRHRQLRQLGAKPMPSGLTDTLVGLSELYWLGLSTLLPSLQVHDQSARTTPKPRAGGERGS